MPRGQGTIEYLLIIAAVLGFLAVVALVVGSVLAPPQQSGDVQLDIISCGNNHTWLKEYTKPYDGANNAPGYITYYEGGAEMAKGGFNTSNVPGETVCLLQNAYRLNFSRTAGKAWLQTTDPAKWVEYSGPGPTETCMGGIGNKDAIPLVGVSYYIGTTEKTTYTYWQASTYPAAIKYGFVNFTLPAPSGITVTSAKICAYYEGGDGGKATDFVSVDGSSVTVGSEDLGVYHCKSVTPTVVQSKLGTRIDFKWSGAVGDTAASQYTQWSDENAGTPAGANTPFMEICYTTP